MRTTKKMRERAVNAFTLELEAMPLETLVEVVDITSDASERRWRQALEGPRRGDWIGRWADGLQTEVDMLARFELACRAADVRASLVERLTAAMDTGDVAAFAEIAATWRALPECLRSFFCVWNGADAPGAFFDPAACDVEPCEFVPSAVRRRVVQCLRAQPEERAA